LISVISVKHQFNVGTCQALIQASQAHEGHLVEHKWIAVSTYGILFLGTPHQGTNVITNTNQPLKLVSLSNKTNTVLLKHLISNSEWLQQQSASYNAISANFRTKFFHETLLTILPDKSFQMVILYMFLSVQIYNALPRLFPDHLL
jgi:hypothetical protein